MFAKLRRKSSTPETNKVADSKPSSLEVTSSSIAGSITGKWKKKRRKSSRLTQMNKYSSFSDNDSLNASRDSQENYQFKTSDLAEVSGELNDSFTGSPLDGGSPLDDVSPDVTLKAPIQEIEPIARFTDAKVDELISFEPIETSSLASSKSDDTIENKIAESDLELLDQTMISTSINEQAFIGDIKTIHNVGSLDEKPSLLELSLNATPPTTNEAILIEF